MKLLMVHSDRDEMYGAVHSMLEMLTNLNKDYGIEPVLLVSKLGNVTDYCKKNGWKYVVTGHGNFMMGAGTKKKQFIRNTLLPLFYLKYKIKNLIALKKIESSLDINDFDIIHTNVNVCDIGAILSKKYNIPHVWHLREFGDLDYNRIAFRKNYIKFMNEHCDYFIAISDAVKNHWVNKGLDENKIVRVYNGVEQIEYNDIKTNSQLLKCCFSGSISKSKGQYIMLEALNNLEEKYKKFIKVDIIGDGPSDYVRTLKKYINKNNMNSMVNFLGYQPNIRQMLNRYDIGFMCSFSEGFGRVTVEYMMAGLCTIASNTGANKELIVEDETGLFFEYPSIESLRNKIEWCIKNRKKINQIGNEAKRVSSEKYTSKNNAKNVFDIYMKIQGEKK